MFATSPSSHTIACGPKQQPWFLPSRAPPPHLLLLHRPHLCSPLHLPKTFCSALQCLKSIMPSSHPRYQNLLTLTDLASLQKCTDLSRALLPVMQGAKGLITALLLKNYTPLSPRIRVFLVQGVPLRGPDRQGACSRPPRWPVLVLFQPMATARASAVAPAPRLFLSTSQSSTT